jgi:hypothetical protein
LFCHSGIFPLAAWDNSDGVAASLCGYGNTGGGAGSLRRQNVYQMARFHSVGMMETLRRCGDIPVAWGYSGAVESLGRHRITQKARGACLIWWLGVISVT